MWKKKRKSKITHPNYHTLTLSLNTGLNDDQASVFYAVFEDCALSFASEKKNGGWAFLWTFDHRPDQGDLVRRFDIIADLLSLPSTLFKDYHVEVLPDKDWLLESYRALPAFTLGPFFIYGSHYDGDIPNHLHPLLIEAATAFGSGTHGTTAGCLLALSALKDQGLIPKNILDMGCGSGILAAGAARLWPDAFVYAADNDPESVRVSKTHFALNGLDRIVAFQSDGYAMQSPVWARAPYDLIIANILARPLIDMAQDQTRAMAQGGGLILSGLLIEQEQEVIAAYQTHGLRVIDTSSRDEWSILTLEKL
jgi:ribosomal protein L11 methyltransferase